MGPRHLSCLAALLLLSFPLSAAEPDPDLVNAEKILHDAKIEPTGDALLQFFRERTLSPTDRSKLADAVRLLGDDEFDTREKAEKDLIGAGTKALPILRPALNDRDVERAHRAARCVEQIDAGQEQFRIAAAAQVLADRKPDGAVAVLLAHLPGSDDEYVEDALFHALLKLGVKDGKADPTLLKALTADEPLARAAAARVLGHLDPEQRAAVRRLLADPDARVRFEAAVGLAHGGDKEAVPALIALLSKGPMPVAWKAQETLYRIAADKSPQLSLADDDGPSRTKVADAWTAWWKDAAPTTDLTKLDLDGTLRGINLICQQAGGGKPNRVWACRADGKPLWEIKDVCAWDAQLLPNGHVLIAEYGNQVTERDTTGKILMTVPLGAHASSCQRLPNGNTFIATWAEFLEVDPKGATLWSHKVGQNVGRAHRLANGNILYAWNGHDVIELDAKFKQLRTASVPKNDNMWMSLEPLPGDRFLVAPYGLNKVMEINAEGKVLWECATTTPMSAVPLPNGNTLVGSTNGKGVIEYSRAGKEVWRLDLEGDVLCARRY